MGGGLVSAWIELQSSRRGRQEATGTWWASVEGLLSPIPLEGPRQGEGMQSPGWAVVAGSQGPAEGGQGNCLLRKWVSDP